MGQPACTNKYIYDKGNINKTRFNISIYTILEHF